MISSSSRYVSEYRSERTATTIFGPLRDLPPRDEVHHSALKGKSSVLSGRGLIRGDSPRWSKSLQLGDPRLTRLHLNNALSTLRLGVEIRLALRLPYIRWLYSPADAGPRR